MAQLTTDNMSKYLILRFKRNKLIKNYRKLLIVARLMDSVVKLVRPPYSKRDRHGESSTFYFQYSVAH